VGGHGVADAIDCVPIGAWNGYGRKKDWFSPWLMAVSPGALSLARSLSLSISPRALTRAPQVYDPETDTFCTLCKVMTGFTDAEYEELTREFSKRALPTAPHGYDVSEALQPTYWFPPIEVWEIRGADLTVSPVHSAARGVAEPERGLSLRFPRFMRKHDSKRPEDATTTQQVAEMFFAQSKVAPAPAPAPAPASAAARQPTESDEENESDAEEAAVVAAAAAATTTRKRAPMARDGDDEEEEEEEDEEEERGGEGRESARASERKPAS
jgi:DNA ligase-1